MKKYHITHNVIIICSLSVRLSASLSICPSVSCSYVACLSICQSIYDVNTPVYMSVRAPVITPVCPSICLSVNLFIHHYSLSVFRMSRLMSEVVCILILVARVSLDKGCSEKNCVFHNNI